MIHIIGMTISGGGKVHAVRYDSETSTVNFFCNSFKYKNYYAIVGDFSPATTETVTCKKCLKNKKEWDVGHHGNK